MARAAFATAAALVFVVAATLRAAQTSPPVGALPVQASEFLAENSATTAATAETAVRARRTAAARPARPRVVFAANLFNSEPLLPHFIRELNAALRALGGGNAGVAIYENGSDDGTPAILREWNASLRGTPRSIVVDGNKRFLDGVERTVRLADARNRVLADAQRLVARDGRIVFLNDVFFESSDVLRMLDVGRHYDVLCAMDHYRGFYDRWVTRDCDGAVSSRWPPYIFSGVDDASAETRVFSCWNGMISLRANVTPAAFRASRADECLSSECYNVFLDLPRADATVALHRGVHIAYDARHYALQNRFLPDYESVFATLNKFVHGMLRHDATVAQATEHSQRGCKGDGGRDGSAAAIDSKIGAPGGGGGGGANSGGGGSTDCATAEDGVRGSLTAPETTARCRVPTVCPLLPMLCC